LILDGDQIGHELFNNTTVQQEIRTRFGDAVFNASGNIDRPALGRLVFGPSAKHQQACDDLESILHPRIRQQFKEEIQTANELGSYEAIVMDAAVLLEAGWQTLCTAVIFVDTAAEIRQQRVVENRGWTKDELQRRESNQLSIHEKKRLSQFTIDNSGTLAAAAASLNDILDRILNSTS
jgi:dephospho-CoA kinase